MWAQSADSVRTYTKERPLVYEDAWDLWPYVFLNEDGEAVGYNVDLLKMIFRELHIPYVIRLKPTSVALDDLKAGRSDLMCGMDANFHDEYGGYSQSVIQIFTHSVAHQKGNSKEKEFLYHSYSCFEVGCKDKKESENLKKKLCRVG